MTETDFIVTVRVAIMRWLCRETSGRTMSLVKKE